MGSKGPSAAAGGFLRQEGIPQGGDGEAPEEAHPGTRASRPHNTCKTLPLSSARVGRQTAPGLCFGRAPAVPVGRVAGCHIPGALSGTQRECMRAGRPRSRVGPAPSLLLLKGARAGLPGRSPADAAELSRLVALRCPSCHFVDHSFFVCFRPAAPSPWPQSDWRLDRSSPATQPACRNGGLPEQPSCGR